MDTLILAIWSTELRPGSAVLSQIRGNLLQQPKESWYFLCKKVTYGPGQCGSISWSLVPCTKGSQVQFPVKAYAPVAGPIPSRGVNGRQRICFSLPYKKHTTNPQVDLICADKIVYV